MTDIKVDIEAACRAAKRYAQLIYYYDHSTRPQYGHKPSVAWHQFSKQFLTVPRGVMILSLISHSYVMELRRLYAEEQARRTGVKG